MKKRTPNWDLWQVGFCVLMVTTNLNQSKAIDAAHAHNALIYRVCVNVICSIGLITVLILRSRAKKPVVEISSAGNTTENAIGITYHSTLNDNWKCELYYLSHAPTSRFALLMFGFALAYLGADRLYKLNPTLAYVSFPALWAGGSAIAVVFFLFALKGMLQQRFPTPETVRVCSTRLTPQGVEDQTPDKITILNWNKLAAVREHEGDLLFWTGVGAGCYIPSNAFASPEERSRFYEAALSLWKNKGGNWEQVWRDYSSSKP